MLWLDLIVLSVVSCKQTFVPRACRARVRNISSSLHGDRVTGRAVVGASQSKFGATQTSNVFHSGTTLNLRAVILKTNETTVYYFTHSTAFCSASIALQGSNYCLFLPDLQAVRVPTALTFICLRLRSSPNTGRYAMVQAR